MSEESERLGRLHDLQELSRRKNFYFSKAESAEALNVLSSLCPENEDDYDAIIKSLVELPSDVGAQFLSEHFKRLLGAKCPLICDLMESVFDSDLGKRLRISLAQRLIVNDPNSALKLLYDSFRRIKGPLPTVRDLWIIRSSLINTGYKNLKQLPLQKPEEAKLIITYILAAAFTNQQSRKALPEHVQIEVLQWANLFRNVPPLPKEIHALIQQTVKTWRKNSIASLAQSVDSFQPTIRDTVADLFPRSGARNPETLMPPPILPEPALPTSPAELPPYDPLKGIKQLSNYIREVEKQLDETRSELEKSNLDFQKVQVDLQVVRSECENANRQVAALRESNARLAMEKDSLQEEIEGHLSSIDTLREELDTARSKHKQEVADYRGQLKTLSERIAREGEIRIDIFRNALGAQIQSYANGLNEALVMEMTIELGLALRNQMNQLVQLLRNEGVRINGGT